MPKHKQEKLTYNDFLEKVRTYVNKHNQDGVRFVCKNEKWLDIYYSNHENKAYSDLIKDAKFKEEIGIN